jgi:2-methylcitrate dehydratase PrpD
LATAAVVHGHVGPEASADATRDDPRVRDLARRVRVVAAADLDARLPDERAARVTVRVAGQELTCEVPNPVGDAAYHPFGQTEVVDLLTALLADPDEVATVRQVTAELPAAADVAPLLHRLAL